MPSDEWPVYGGNVQHTARTAEPGPAAGELAWRFQANLAWYAAPTIEDDRVYAPSLSFRNMLDCLDLESGEVLWRTGRHQYPDEIKDRFPWGHHTPAVASTPVLSNGSVVLNELGAQGKDSAARNLLFVDRESGEIDDHADAEHLDYRTGYSSLVGNDELLVYPVGTHEIASRPPRITELNRIVARDATSKEILFDVEVGPVYGDPVVVGEEIYVGTRDGDVFRLDVSKDAEGKWHAKPTPIEWHATLGAGITSSGTAWEETVIYGANDGVVHALDRESGEHRWTYEVEEHEPRAFKFFSPPTVVDGTVVIGDATGRVHGLDAESGALEWQFEADDWVRARPIGFGDHVFVADLSGTVYALSPAADRAELAWRQDVTSRPIFADLRGREGTLLANSSDLYTWALDTSTGEIRWRHSLLPGVERDGERVPTDMLSARAGGQFQSKPTAADGKIFFGDPARFLYALDHETGEELWRHEVGAAISCAPAYDDGYLFFGQQGGEEEFYCLDAETGERRWSQTIGWVWSSANVYEGRVFVPTVNGDFYCLDADTGAVQWRHKTRAAAHPEPAVDPTLDQVYFGAWNGYVYAFDVADGQLNWKFHAEGTPDSGTPIANDGKLYLPTGGNWFRCLDGESGEILWEYTDDVWDFNASPALDPDEEKLFISKRRGHDPIPMASRVTCLDATDGTELWKHPGGGLTSPVIAGDKVYFGSLSSPFFYCVEEDGNPDGTTDELWRYQMGDRVDESVPAIYEERAYIVSADGYIYAIE